MGYFF